MLKPNLPSINDEEGAAVPEGLPMVVDAHVHVFPRDLCRADKLERVLVDFPGLKVCVPHLGFDEISEYRRLIEKYDTLRLDTTMVLTDYFPLGGAIDLGGYRLDRIMYGSDFPSIPYAWDRELKWLRESRLSSGDLEWILHKSASDFFNLNLQPLSPEKEPPVI